MANALLCTTTIVGVEQGGELGDKCKCRAGVAESEKGGDIVGTDLHLSNNSIGMEGREGPD